MKFKVHYIKKLEMKVEHLKKEKNLQYDDSVSDDDIREEFASYYQSKKKQMIKERKEQKKKERKEQKKKERKVIEV